jgi:hypothetical protein
VERPLSLSVVVAAGRRARLIAHARQFSPTLFPSKAGKRRLGAIPGEGQPRRSQVNSKLEMQFCRASFRDSAIFMVRLRPNLENRFVGKVGFRKRRGDGGLYNSFFMSK